MTHTWRMLTHKEAADRIGVDYTTLHLWVSQGVISMAPNDMYYWHEVEFLRRWWQNDYRSTNGLRKIYQ